MSIDLSSGLPIAALRNETTAWPSFVPDGFKFKGYEVDENNRPTFKYTYKSAEFEDQILPTADGKSLQRTITQIGAEANLYVRLAVGEQIHLLPNGLYSVDGNYYIEGNNCLLRNKQELLIKMEDKIQYTIHW